MPCTAPSDGSTGRAVSALSGSMSTETSLFISKTAGSVAAFLVGGESKSITPVSTEDKVLRNGRGSSLIGTALGIGDDAVEEFLVAGAG